MKFSKLVSLILVLAVALTVAVSCGPQPCDVHTDADHDQKCDVCEADVPCTEHKDGSDADIKCDWCGADVPCDKCASTDEDGKCDRCGTTIPCNSCVDGDDADLKCDTCGKTVPCVEHIDGDDAAYMKGKRVLIVDDVISTGGSLESLENLVRLAGGEIVGKMTILAEGEAAQRDDIIYLEKLPLFDGNGNPI